MQKRDWSFREKILESSNLFLFSGLILYFIAQIVDDGLDSLYRHSTVVLDLDGAVLGAGLGRRYAVHAGDVFDHPAFTVGAGHTLHLQQCCHGKNLPYYKINTIK